MSDHVLEGLESAFQNCSSPVYQVGLVPPRWKAPSEKKPRSWLACLLQRHLTWPPESDCQGKETSGPLPQMLQGPAVPCGTNRDLLISQNRWPCGQIVVYTAAVSKPQPVGRMWPLPVFVNKVLLNSRDYVTAQFLLCNCVATGLAHRAQKYSSSGL